MESLQAWIAQLELDRSIDRPERLRERVHALDQLDDLLIHQQGMDAALRRRCSEQQQRLEDAQRELARQIRAAIQRGEGAAALHPWMAPSEEHAAGVQDGGGYDHLDALLSDVLAFDEPSATAELESDMVFYQPTPIRHIAGLIEHAAIRSDDVLVDIGSGLGHVPMLVSICTGARCIGIERDAAYVDIARRASKSLHLQNIEFIAQDARDADLSQGTLFYLFTPFTRALLREVLDKLRQEARHRPFRIATLGPCTAIIGAEPWLQAHGSVVTGRVALFATRLP